MGRVLLIEPQRILGHALSLSLFFDHEVQTEVAMSTALAGSLGRYDLLVIDAAALRESRQLTPELVRTVQSCKTPVLWLDDEKAPGIPRRDRLEVILRPVEKEAFHAAVETLLTGGSRRKGRASAKGERATGEEKSAGKKRDAAKEAPGEPIDLFDVVEEGPKPQETRRPARKKKRK